MRKDELLTEVNYGPIVVEAGTNNPDRAIAQVQTLRQNGLIPPKSEVTITKLGTGSDRQLRVTQLVAIEGVEPDSITNSFTFED